MSITKYYANSTAVEDKTNLSLHGKAVTVSIKGEIEIATLQFYPFVLRADANENNPFTSPILFRRIPSGTLHAKRVLFVII